MAYNKMNTERLAPICASGVHFNFFVCSFSFSLLSIQLLIIILIYFIIIFPPAPNYRIQNMNTAAGAKPEYKGSIDVLLKVSQKEGVFKLWKGFTPYFLRLGPHTVITFILMEQMHILYKSSMK